MRLSARRIHIAGSASTKTEAELISHAHQVVKEIVRAALREGTKLVVQAGPEPRFITDDPTSPALVFDWTIIEEVKACLDAGITEPCQDGEQLVFAVSSEKAEQDIPPNRRALWHELLDSGAVHLEHIRPGSRSAGAMREIQAREGNVLITLGGGAGVEHLAEMYSKNHRPIIPLDANIGASRDDGTLGGSGLARLVRTRPTNFFRLNLSGSEASRLTRLTLAGGTADPVQVGERVVNLLRDLALPTAFFIRLLNRDHEDFIAVEDFFRTVIEPVIKEAGYQRHEVGTDVSRSGFINTEIFEELYYSPLVISDLTGLRPNCFLELGYALRSNAKVLVTAKSGTRPPFDIAAVQWHFWEPSLPNPTRIALLKEFWQKNINRPALVRPKVLF